jgi:hypothetical protein
VSRGTQEPLERGLQFRIRGFHPLWPAFPDRSPIAHLPSLKEAVSKQLSAFSSNQPSLPPALLLLIADKLSAESFFLWSFNPELSLRIARFGLFRFRSPLLAESRLLSLPRGTEMVHFPRFAPYAYVFSAR